MQINDYLVRNCSIIARSWVLIPDACDFFHRAWESTEYTVLTHVGVYSGLNQNYYSLSHLQISI